MRRQWTQRFRPFVITCGAKASLRYAIVASTRDTSSSRSRIEPGPQAYTGVSGGIEHEKSIIAAIKDRVGGIMFWAANEAAVSSLNGKTTGENSGTLAAYAAELVA